MKVCPTCYERPSYYDRYDLFACITCDEWLELPCSCVPDDFCPFEKPPSKPSEVEA